MVRVSASSTFLARTAWALGLEACSPRRGWGWGCMGGFAGPPAGHSWPSPPYTHPFKGAEPPSRLSATLGGMQGAGRGADSLCSCCGSGKTGAVLSLK